MSFLEASPQLFNSRDFNEALKYDRKLMEKMQLREDQKLKEVQDQEVTEVDWKWKDGNCSVQIREIVGNFVLWQVFWDKSGRYYGDDIYGFWTWFCESAKYVHFDQYMFYKCWMEFRVFNGNIQNQIYILDTSHLCS